MVPAPQHAPLPVTYPGTTLYRYFDLDGNLLSYVSRRETKGGKTILPWTYGILDGVEGWHCRRPYPPLPLYRLPFLKHAEPDWDVFLVEGEKACDALNRMLRKENYAAIAMTWQGGSDNVNYVDWHPLEYRNVILWPDADVAGLKCMNAIAKLLPISTRILAKIETEGLAENFDAADLQEPLHSFLQKRCR